MKELIEMQPFNRSQVDQSRLFSLDYETVSEPAVPLIHQESRFLFALDGAGKIVIQGKEYDFRRGTLVSILPWQVSEISAVEKPVQYVIIRYHFDTVQNVIHLFSDVSGDPCSSLTRIEDHAAVQLSEDKIADVRNIVQLIREELGIESSKNLHAEKELENIAVLNLIVYLTVIFTRAATEQPESGRSECVDSVDILRYMYLHCNEKLTLKKIAQQFYYSESTVSAHITQMTGLSFFDLLNEMRICKTVNYLLYTDLTLRELAEIFDISGITKSPAIFDMQKLRYINGEYIRKLSPEEFYEKALPWIRKTVKSETADLRELCTVLQTRCEALSDIPEQVDFIDALPDYDIELYTSKKMKTTPETAREALTAVLPILESLPEWNAEAIHAALFAEIEKLGVKNGWLLYPLRVAVSGKQFTPGGGIELAVVLGREETLRRIRTALEKLG